MKCVIGILLVLACTALGARAATIVVRQTDNLQAKVDSAGAGDVVVIDKGAIFPSLVLSRSGITIMTSGNLPAPGARPGPAQENEFAKIVSPSSSPAIEVAADVHDVKVSGLVISSVGGQVFTPELVLVGSRSSGGGIPAGHAPHDITFDQVWGREATNDTTTPTSAMTTCDRIFNVSGSNIAITNSRLCGCRMMTANSSAESANAVLATGTSNLRLVNNYIEAGFVPVFFAPSADSSNTATLTNPSYNAVDHTWEVDFFNVSNLHAGDLVAMKVTGGRMPLTNNAHPNEAVVFEVGKVTAIDGSHVSGISWGSYDGNILSGNPLLQTPDAPGMALWNGNTNLNPVIQRNDFVTTFDASEYVWTHTGGCSTLTRPYPCINSDGSPKTGNAPKSFIEIKSAVNALIDGNTFDGWYTSPVLLTSRNQGNTLTSGGSPWTGVSGKFTNNWIRHMRNWDRPYSLVIGGPQLEDNEYSNVRSGPLLFQNNLFDSGVGPLLSSMSAADNVTVVNNTFPGAAGGANSFVIAQGAPSANFTLQANIIANGEYGKNCQITGGCQWPGLVQDHNVIIDNRSAGSKTGDGPLHLAGDVIAADTASVGWVDAASGNYRLSATSSYKGKGLNGKDPGVDMDALLAAIGSAGVPPASTATPPFSTTCTVQYAANVPVGGPWPAQQGATGLTFNCTGCTLVWTATGFNLTCP